MMRRLITVLCFLLVSSVCATASDLKISFYSDPPFATLYADHQKVGLMTGTNPTDGQIVQPITLKYPLPKKGSQCIDLPSVFTAVWASGAKFMVKGGHYCLRDKHKDLGLVLKRPNVPGADIDWGLASEFYRIAADGLQAQINIWETFQAQQRQAQQDRLLQQQIEALQRTLHCDSQVFGNTISTNCY